MLLLLNVKLLFSAVRCLCCAGQCMREACLLRTACCEVLYTQVPGSCCQCTMLHLVGKAVVCCSDDSSAEGGSVSCNSLQVIDPNILKQYIFQKGFITESAKLKREQEAASATLQVGHT